jgi:hypothetical protein
MTPEQFDAFWTPARLAALDAAAAPWMADEATYAAWTRTHPAPTLAACCGLAVQVGLVTEGLRHYQARAQAAEAERDAAEAALKALADFTQRVVAFFDDIDGRAVSLGWYGSALRRDVLMTLAQAVGRAGAETAGGGEEGEAT